MRLRLNRLTLMLVVVLAAGSCTTDNDTPVLKGPYFGLNAPGETPELFAPGIISTGLDELNSVFSPDGREFYFCVRNSSGAVSIFCVKLVGDEWSRPVLLPFASRYGDIDVTLSPDGSTMLFCSRRPVHGGGEPNDDYDFWMSERDGDTWGTPVHLGEDVNSDRDDFYPMMAGSGALYFSSQREGPGTNNIYVSQFADGKYSEAVKLGGAINTEHREFDPYVSPDESMLIFTSNRPGGFGFEDLYISTKDDDGEWTAARNLGDTINTPGAEYCAMMSPDGKYLFFTGARRRGWEIPERALTYKDFEIRLNRPENGMSDIYWVDAQVITAMK